MKKFTPDEFWQDMVTAAGRNLQTPENLVIDTNVVKHLAVEQAGTVLKIQFADEDGLDQVTVRRTDIAEGNYMRQGEDDGPLAWSFETSKGSFTLRTIQKRPSMPAVDGSKLDGIEGVYTDGREGAYTGVAGTVVTVDYHNMLLYEADENAADTPPKAVFRVTDSKRLAAILNG